MKIERLYVYVLAKKCSWLFAIMVVTLIFCPQAYAADGVPFAPISFNDAAGSAITLKQRPQRVVSLVPTITETLLRLGAADRVVGITYHSILPPQAAGKEIVGGFFTPDVSSVAALKPDIIFYSTLQHDVVRYFKDNVQMVCLDAHGIAQSFSNIKLLGKIFNRSEQAQKIISAEKRQLELISAKVAKIPPQKRLRVMRLMGRDAVMTPGDDSFQNEYIRAAGGIAPGFGEVGNIISVTLQQWQKFNPQLLYACGGDKQVLKLLQRPGWRDVDAVRNHRIVFFPCELTCRAATHTGYFTAWLASAIYPEQFGDRANFVLPQQVVKRRAVPLQMDYVKSAEVVTTTIKDFANKAVVVRFKQPLQVVSTLEGERDNITAIANNYFPPPSWGLGHSEGLAKLRADTLQVLGLDPAATAILFTGANMENMAVVEKHFRDMRVVAIVTAGVMGNAMRMGYDDGGYYELDHADKKTTHGTINVLLLSNTRLSKRAMTRAIISATEAKSAALQDLDIRSSYSRSSHQATGTGTDNIIVASGVGSPVDSSGGHTKMGELIARAVYAGVQQAIHKQNGVVQQRSVFQRLRERGITVYELCKNYAELADIDDAKALQSQFEYLLLQPRNGAFIKSLMAISDAFDAGLITDTTSIDLWCRQLAAVNCAGKIPPVRSINIKPEVVAKGLSALLAAAEVNCD